MLSLTDEVESLAVELRVNRTVTTNDISLNMAHILDELRKTNENIQVFSSRVITSGHFAPYKTIKCFIPPVEHVYHSTSYNYEM